MEFSIEGGVEVLRRTPEGLRAMLAGLPDGWLTGDEGPDTWTPWQVAGHLTHIEETDWIDRTRVILEHGTSREFEPVDREAGFTRFAGWPIERVLDRFAAVRAENLEGEQPRLHRIRDVDIRLARLEGRLVGDGGHLQSIFFKLAGSRRLLI